MHQGLTFGFDKSTVENRNTCALGMAVRDDASLPFATVLLLI